MIGRPLQIEICHLSQRLEITLPNIAHLTQCLTITRGSFAAFAQLTMIEAQPDTDLLSRLAGS